jgi:hypothetical protein
MTAAVEMCEIMRVEVQRASMARNLVKSELATSRAALALIQQPLALRLAYQISWAERELRERDSAVAAAAAALSAASKVVADLRLALQQLDVAAAHHDAPADADESEVADEHAA